MMKKNSLIVITGGIASGKSFVLKIFEEIGFVTFDSDTLARNLMNDPEILSEISKNLDLKQTVELLTLKKMIANNPNILDVVEMVIHPIIYEKRNVWIKQMLDSYHKPVVEIPLFFEKNLDVRMKQKYAVTVLSLICNTKQRIKRAKDRNYNLSDKMLNTIVLRQCNDQEKLAKSDFVIYTCLHYKHTVDQTKCFIELYMQSHD